MTRWLQRQHMLQGPPSGHSRRFLEGSGLTNGPKGTPVTLTSGFLAIWNGSSYTGAIAGILAEPVTGRTTSGVAQIISPLAEVIENQPYAVNIALPKWDDGKLSAYTLADGATIFWGQVGPTQGGANLTQANVGVAYGLTADTDYHWYVDTSKTTTSGGGSSNQAVLVIESLDPNDNRGVFFKFLPAAAQLGVG